MRRISRSYERATGSDEYVCDAAEERYKFDIGFLSAKAAVYATYTGNDLLCNKTESRSGNGDEL